METKRTRRNLITRAATKILGASTVAAVGIAAAEMKASAAVCGWYDSGQDCGCGAFASCALTGGYGRMKRQQYYCNGVPTGATRCVKSRCGC